MVNIFGGRRDVCEYPQQERNGERDNPPFRWSLSFFLRGGFAYFMGKKSVVL